MSRRRREGIESYTAANQMAMNERESERRSKGFNMRNRRDGEISRASSKSPPETQKGPEGPSRAKRALRAGGALLSRGASPAVPSALAGLTSGFGSGTGCAPAAPAARPGGAFLRDALKARPAGRRRPTLPRGLPRSTLGAGGLNFRVRVRDRVCPRRPGRRPAGRAPGIRPGAPAGALGAAWRWREPSLPALSSLPAGPRAGRAPGLGLLVAPG